VELEFFPILITNHKSQTLQGLAIGLDTSSYSKLALQRQIGIINIFHNVRSNVQNSWFQILGHNCKIVMAVVFMLEGCFFDKEYFQLTHENYFKAPGCS
jgi:hypothetical protein